VPSWSSVKGIPPILDIIYVLLDNLLHCRAWGMYAYMVREMLSPPGHVVLRVVRTIDIYIILMI